MVPKVQSSKVMITPQPKSVKNVKKKWNILTVAVTKKSKVGYGKGAKDGRMPASPWVPKSEKLQLH